jgi:hypothetical protein
LCIGRASAVQNTARDPNLAWREKSPTLDNTLGLFSSNLKINAEPAQTARARSIVRGNDETALDAGSRHGPRNMNARRSVVGVLLAAAALVSSGRASAATRYVFATFLGDDASKQKLSLYTSKNGLDFTLLSNTGYAGPTGVLRDPSLMKHTDGLYYIAYTLKSWTTTSSAFAIASSPDLKTWTFRTEVPAQVTDVKDTWAPEWFKDTDGKIHLIVSIDTNTTQFKSYLYTASDDTLGKWGAPVPLGIGPNYIDTFVVKVGTGYHAFTKNETTKFIEHATAPALTGPWTFVGKGDWAGWGSGKEGPALFQLDSGQWRLTVDCYGNCGFLQATSTDLNTWSGITAVPGLSGVARHGTVLREDDAAAGGSNGSGGVSGTGGANHAGAGGARSSGAGSSSAGSSAAAGTSSTGHAGTGGSGFDSAGSAGAAALAGATNQAGSAGSPAATGGATGGAVGGATSSGGASHAVAGDGNATPAASDGCSCSLPGANRRPDSALALLLALGAGRRAVRRRTRSPSR